MKDKKFIQILVFIVIFIVAIFALSYRYTLSKIDFTPKVNAVYTVKNRVDTTLTNTPSIEEISSSEAFFAMETSVKETYSNSKVISCKGSPIISDAGTFELNNIGELPNWLCSYYSDNPKVDFNAKWSQGKAQLELAHQIWYPEDTTIDPSTRNFYSPLEYIDSKYLHSQLILSGFSPETEYYELYIGDLELSEKYKERKIWQVFIYSKKDFGKKEDGSFSGSLLRKALYDGDTGKLIDFL